MRIAQIPDERAIRTLGNRYGIIQAKIKKEILNIDVLNFSLMRVTLLRKKIDGYIKQLNEIAEKFSKSQIPMTYNDMKNKASVSLKALKRKSDPDFNDEIFENSIQNRINEMNKYMAKANKSITTLADSYFMMLGNLNTKIMQVQEFANLSPEDETQLLTWIQDATEAQDMKGLSRNSLASKIMEYLQAKVSNGNFIIVNGRKYNLKKYSMLVARTELRRTQTDAVKNACGQYNNDLVEISDHGTETEICIPFEGNIYSLSGSSQRYPEIEDYPPYHPNCQHYMSPTSEEAIQFGRGR